MFLELIHSSLLHVNGENTPNPPILENEDPGTFSLYCNLTNEYVDTVSQQNVVFVVLSGVAVTFITLSHSGAVVNVPPPCQLTVACYSTKS